MGLFSSIGNLFSAIIDAIVDLVEKLIEVFGPVLVIIALIYLAPYLAPMLTSIGVPASVTTWMTTAATTAQAWIGAAAEFVWSGVGELASTAWTAFKGMEASSKIATVVGLSAAIAPEETAAVIADLAESATSVVTGVVGGLLDNPLALGALLVGGYFLFFHGKGGSSGAGDGTQLYINSSNPDDYPDNSGLLIEGEYEEVVEIDSNEPDDIGFTEEEVVYL